MSGYTKQLPLRPPIFERFADNPLGVHAAKLRSKNGDQLGELGIHETRQYNCRTCGKQEMATGVPRGWYWLTRSRGMTGPSNSHRLGTYCCIDCLQEQAQKLSVMEVRLGSKWDQSTERFRTCPPPPEKRRPIEQVVAAGQPSH